jgi:hypothetical protein
MKYLTLLSTAVVPEFNGRLTVRPLSIPELRDLLPKVAINLCTHDETIRYLRTLYPDLPSPMVGRWNGESPAIAVRPRGGRRGYEGREVPLHDGNVEAAMIIWQPGFPYEPLDQP